MSSKHNKNLIFRLMVILILSLVGCKKSTNDSHKKKTEDSPKGLILSRVTGITKLSADKNSIETGEFAKVTMEIRVNKNKNFTIFWESSCGIISPAPEGLKAMFIAPNSPSVCSISAIMKDDDMKEISKKSIVIEVKAQLEEEIQNEI